MRNRFHYFVAKVLLLRDINKYFKGKNVFVSLYFAIFTLPLQTI